MCEMEEKHEQQACVAGVDFANGPDFVSVMRTGIAGGKLIWQAQSAESDRGK